MDFEKILSESIDAFNAKRLNCAETVVSCMSRYLGIESDLLPRLATPFGGGIGGTQKLCGLVSGGLMIIGILYGREEGGDQVPAKNIARDFMAAFEKEAQALTCRELIRVDTSIPEQAQAMRAPGGAHYTVCVPLTGWVCRYLKALADAKADK